MQQLVILGAGGFARETLDVVDAINAKSPAWDMIGFLVDSQYGQPGDLINGKPILGNFSWLGKNPNVHIVCGIGTSEIRFKVIEQVKQWNQNFATLIHPNAVITQWVSIGVGTIITAGCIFTNNIVIGDHVQVNLDCTIGHDAVLDNYSTLAPGVHVSGNVHIQKGSYIGTGANINEKKIIGEWSIVGSGSTVVKDVPANSTVVGVPAKVIKQRTEGWYLNEDQH